MEELVNIANYCNTIRIKYGEKVHECNAVYIKSDDVIEFMIRYWVGDKLDYFKYVVPNYNFMITDTDVLMNRSSIDKINEEVTKRL
mgnify:FL=1